MVKRGGGVMRQQSSRSAGVPPVSAPLGSHHRLDQEVTSLSTHSHHETRGIGNTQHQQLHAGINEASPQLQQEGDSSEPLTNSQMADSNNELASGKKGVRGLTRNLELAKMPPGEKKKLDWDAISRPIGASASNFANLIGTVVRAEENIPLEITGWNKVPLEKKQKCYDKVREMFEFEETEKRKEYVMKDMGVKFREHRHTLRKVYRRFTSDRQRLSNPPKEVSTRAWSWLVTYWSSPEYQALCAKNKANRMKGKAGHCTGSKSFARVINEHTLATGQVPTRKVVYIKTRTKPGGRAVNNHAAAIMAKMTQLSTQVMEGRSEPLTDEEIWAETFPPDRSGRVMCMGSNVTPSQLFGRRRASEEHHREEVNSLRSQLESTQSRLESTEKELEQTKSAMEKYGHDQAKQKEELNGVRGRLDLILGALQGQGFNLDFGVQAPVSGGSSCG